MRGLRDWAVAADRCVRLLGNALAGGSALAMVAMMLIVSVDVSGRYIFNHSLIGGYELVQYAMVVTVFLSFAHGQFVKTHISIDILAARLSSRRRAALNSVTLLVMLAVLLLITWGDSAQAVVVWQGNETSQVLLIPKWPFQSVTVIGMAVFCLVTLVDLLHSLAEASRREG